MKIKGFELKLNDKYINLALKGKGIITIILSIQANNKQENTITLEVGGVESTNDDEITYKWLNENLTVEDTLTIKVKDLIKNSKPQFQTKITQEEKDKKRVEEFKALEKKLKKLKRNSYF